MSLISFSILSVENVSKCYKNSQDFRINKFPWILDSETISRDQLTSCLRVDSKIGGKIVGISAERKDRFMTLWELRQPSCIRVTHLPRMHRSRRLRESERLACIWTSFWALPPKYYPNVHRGSSVTTYLEQDETPT